MNTKRLYIGDLYYNDGLESSDTYKIDLVEKNVLLLKVGNRFIRANMIENKMDIVSLYTFLKYYPTSKQYAISDIMYRTNDNKKGVIFVDKKSLKKYSTVDEKITFDRFKKISMSYDYVKSDEKSKKL